MPIKLHVVVTYHASRTQRAIFDDLSAVAELSYLKDLQDPEERVELAQKADVLVGWRPERELGPTALAACTDVRFVQLLSAGADRLNPSAFPGRTFFASNAGAFAEPIAEHVLAMVLALQKRLVQGHEELRRGIMDQVTPSRALRGSTVGIIGHGAIGRAVADVFRPFGCPILALNRTGDIEDEVSFRGTLLHLDRVLEQSDIVVLCLPLTPQTRSLLDHRKLWLLKENAILINVSRAAIIDEVALYARLEVHPRTLAGIDVWWDEVPLGERFQPRTPLLDLPNVLGSPHNSGITPFSQDIAAERAMENVLRFVRGERPQNVLRAEDLFAS